MLTEPPPWRRREVQIKGWGMGWNHVSRMLWNHVSRILHRPCTLTLHWIQFCAISPSKVKLEFPNAGDHPCPPHIPFTSLLIDKKRVGPLKFYPRNGSCWDKRKG